MVKAISARSFNPQQLEPELGGREGFHVGSRLKVSEITKCQGGGPEPTGYQLGGTQDLLKSLPDLCIWLLPHILVGTPAIGVN